MCDAAARAAMRAALERGLESVDAQYLVNEMVRPLPVCARRLSGPCVCVCVCVCARARARARA